MTDVVAWRTSRLGDLVKITSGQSPSQFRFVGNGTPYFKVEQLGRSEKYLSRELTPYLSQELPTVPAGSVLFAKRGGAIALNRIRILSEPAFMDTNVMALTASDQVLPEFLYFVLSYVGLGNLADVTSIPQINNKHIIPFKILLPPVAEQQRIVDSLGDVDQVINSLERLIAKKQAIRHGMTQQLLTGKTRLPGFTSEWVETLLGDHVLYVKTVALSRAELDTYSPLRYLHYGDIHTSDNVRLDAAHEEMPRASAAKARNAGRLQVGDLVFADASEDPDGVGKSIEVVSIPASGVVPGLHTIAARFDKTVLVDGFKAYLQFIPGFRDALLRLASGTKVLATTRKYISSVALRLPEVAEQHAIAAMLHDADTEIAVLERQLENVRNIKQGMMQELLTGRTRLIPSEATA